MRRVLVTGANGLLGQKLVKLLSEDSSIRTIATGRKEISCPAGVEFISLDITNSSQAHEVLLRIRPTTVINTAAMTQVDECETQRDACWQTNVTGVENLMRACEQIDSHLVHLSTDFIFDGTAGPLDESALPNPVNYYGECKWAGEKVVQQSTIDWTVIRTVLVYGIVPDMSRSNIVLWVKKSLEEGKKINVVNDQWRTPTLAEDLATGCYLVSTKKATGVYHISGEGMMTPYDIALETADFFNLDKSLVHVTDSTKFTQPAKRPPKTGFIIKKAKRELGYHPHTFREGLALMAKQLKA